MRKWINLAAAMAVGAGLVVPGALIARPEGAGASKSAPADPAPAPSESVSHVASWVIESADNNGLPFMIIDKVAAGVWVFDANGLFMGAAPALVGATAGDDAEPGVGDRELSDIPPAQRTTPAGRFVASFGRAAGGRTVLWVDYPTAVSLHAVITHNKKERRLERLASLTPDDNRITYGCINVPAAFYKSTVKTLFSTAHGIVYVLPETKPLPDAFQGYRPPTAAYQAVPSR